MLAEASNKPGLAAYCAGEVGDIGAVLAGGGVSPGDAGFMAWGAGAGGGAAKFPAVGLFSLNAVRVGPWPAPNTIAIRATTTTAPAIQAQPDPYERPAGS
jgi:hypothetical protein